MTRAKYELFMVSAEPLWMDGPHRDPPAWSKGPLREETRVNAGQGTRKGTRIVIIRLK